MKTVKVITFPQGASESSPAVGDQPQPGEWKSALRRDKVGKFLADESNLTTAIESAPEWSGLFGYDEGERAIFALRQPPFTTKESAPFRWDDEHDTRLRIWLIDSGFAKPSQTTVAQCVHAISKGRSFHRVREYLKGLGKWDGRNRIEKWLTAYLGVKDSPYTRAVGKCFLVAMVARALQPGCKVDTILILEGRQGMGKSTLLRELAGAEFFVDNIADFRSRDAKDQAHGKWLIELPEIERLIKGHGASVVKAFTSSAIDLYRPAYGRRKIESRRDSVLVGTTNRQEYLIDSTGNRRYWPVWCEKADVAGILRDRDLLWAQAVACFQAGEQWHLTREIEDAAVIEQRLRVESHPWEDLILPFIAKRADVTLKEVFDAPLSGEKRTDGAEKIVAKILINAGWYQRRPRKHGGRERRYFKPGEVTRTTRTT